MAQRPSKKSKNVFTQTLDGVYGIFKTTESFTLSYLLTNLRAAELAKLQTASEAFHFRTISFDELIQRDVDYERVDNEIVAKYLEQGKDHVLFFPPLLVTVVAIDDGHRIDTYEEVKTALDEDSQSLITTWGSDKFQLELCLESQTTGHKISHKGKDLHYLPYASSLRYNPEAVKLVVIDGQHRFVALKRIYESEEKRHLLQEMEVPICIFFMPEAVKDNKKSESIVRDLRELFITINSKAKEVSGHFLVLLNDRSLSSHCVRQFADALRQHKIHELGSLLPILEWNTREARKAFQRQKKYSISTVSVIADALKDYVMCRKEDGLPQILLNLSSVQNKLKVTPDSYSYNSIEEETFGPEQIAILTEQINKYVTPSLWELFISPRPYKSVIEKFASSLKRLDKLVSDKTTGAEQFRDNVLYQFRKTTDRDLVPVRDMERIFEEGLEIEDGDETYFYNVFQQGLIRAWAELCLSLTSDDSKITPQVVAKAMVAACEKLVFNDKKKMFLTTRPYLQGLIFLGERVLVNESARRAWMLLIIGSLYSSKVRIEFKNVIEQQKPKAEWLSKLDELVATQAAAAICDYFDLLERRIEEDYEKNWRYKAIEKADLNYLLARADDPEKSDEFQEKLSELSSVKIKEAKEAFSNMIDTPIKKVFSSKN